MRRATLLQVAPHGGLRLGNTGASWHYGTYFGQFVELNAGARVKQRRFAGWTELGSCPPLTEEERTRATALGLDPNQVYPLMEKEKHVLLPLAANSKMRLGIRYESGPGLANTASRFRVMSMEGATVRGGSTFLMRH